MTGDLHFLNCRMTGNRGASFVSCKYGRRGPFLDAVNLTSCELRCDEGEGRHYGFIFDADGEVRNCKLEMGRRTAFVGWSRRSDANPRFIANEVHGSGFAAGRPILRVKATAGVPVIERNRFVVPDSTALKGAGGRSPILVDNPNARIAGNRILTEQQFLLDRINPAT
jgi:hypothetical protein